MRNYYSNDFGTIDWIYRYEMLKEQYINADYSKRIEDIHYGAVRNNRKKYYENDLY